MKILMVLSFVVLMLCIEAYATKEAKGKGRGFVSGAHDRCVFPFTYSGKTYRDCTYADWQRPWCSLDSTFDDDWTNCDCSESEADRLNCEQPSECVPFAEGKAAKCFVPFIPTGGGRKR